MFFVLCLVSPSKKNLWGMTLKLEVGTLASFSWVSDHSNNWVHSEERHQPEVPLLDPPHKLEQGWSKPQSSCIVSKVEPLFHKWGLSGRREPCLPNTSANDLVSWMCRWGLNEKCCTIFLLFWYQKNTEWLSSLFL